MTRRLYIIFQSIDDALRSPVAGADHLRLVRTSMDPEVNEPSFSRNTPMNIHEFDYYGQLWIFLVFVGGAAIAGLGKLALDRWGRRTWRQTAEQLDFSEGISSESGQPTLSGRRDGRFVEVRHDSWKGCPHSPVLHIRVELHDFWDDIHIESQAQSCRHSVTPIDTGDEAFDDRWQIEALEQSALNREFPTDKLGPLLAHPALDSKNLRIADGELQLEWRVHFATTQHYQRLVDWLSTVAASLDAIARGESDDATPPTLDALPTRAFAKVASLSKWGVSYVLAAALITGGWYFGVAGSLGEPCASPFECRSQLCVYERLAEHTDDTPLSYCSVQCTDSDDCSGELDCRNAGIDDPYCLHPDVVRRHPDGDAAGESCRSNSDCYSKMCLPWDEVEDALDDIGYEGDDNGPEAQMPPGLCAPPCQTDSDCGDDLICEWSACIPAGQPPSEANSSSP